MQHQQFSKPTGLGGMSPKEKAVLGSGGTEVHEGVGHWVGHWVGHGVEHGMERGVEHGVELGVEHGVEH